MMAKKNPFSVGTGVNSNAVEAFIKAQTHMPTLTVPEDNDRLEDENGNVYIFNPTGQIKYSTTPTIKGQYEKPKFWKLGELRANIYKLGNSKELKSYNSLLRLASREDPGVQIVELDKQFHNGEFIVMVTYRTILYLALTTKQ